MYLRHCNIYSVSSVPFPATVTHYGCNRGGTYRRGKRRKIQDFAKRMTEKQQYSKAKYCGCEFSMKIVQPVEAEKNVEVRYLRSLISNFCPLFSISITQHNIFMTPFISLLFSHRIRVKAW